MRRQAIPAPGRNRDPQTGVSDSLCACPDELSSASRGRRLALLAGSLLLLVAAAVIVVFVLTSSPSPSPRGVVESIFQDDDHLLYSPTPTVTQTLDTLRGLGVDRLRLTVLWAAIAPGPLARVRPPTFRRCQPCGLSRRGLGSV